LGRHFIESAVTRSAKNNRALSANSFVLMILAKIESPGRKLFFVQENIGSRFLNTLKLGQNQPETNWMIRLEHRSTKLAVFDDKILYKGFLQKSEQGFSFVTPVNWRHMDVRS
jgi:hypothetical protein